MVLASALAFGYFKRKEVERITMSEVEEEEEESGPFGPLWETKPDLDGEHLDIQVLLNACTLD